MVWYGVSTKNLPVGIVCRVGFVNVGVRICLGLQTCPIYLLPLRWGGTFLWSFLKYWVIEQILCL